MKRAGKSRRIAAACAMCLAGVACPPADARQGWRGNPPEVPVISTLSGAEIWSRLRAVIQRGGAITRRDVAAIFGVPIADADIAFNWRSLRFRDGSSGLGFVYDRRICLEDISGIVLKLCGRARTLTELMVAGPFGRGAGLKEVDCPSNVAFLAELERSGWRVTRVPGPRIYPDGSFPHNPGPDEAERDGVRLRITGAASWYPGCIVSVQIWRPDR